MSGLGDITMSFEDRFKVQKCFTLLNKDVDMSTLDKRIIFQKTIYLLKAFGVNLNYYFSWYLRGPYSTTLADDGYALNSLEPESRLELTHDVDVESDMVFINKTKDFIKDLEENLQTRNERSRLELSASLHFLSKYTLNGKGGFERAYQRLRFHKPRFNKREASCVWKLMEKHKLI